MHARFADPEPASPDSEERIETETLEYRIEVFKQNPKNMAALHEMLDEVVLRAETEANKRAFDGQKLQQGKEKRPSEYPYCFLWECKLAGIHLGHALGCIEDLFTRILVRFLCENKDNRPSDVALKWASIRLVLTHIPACIYGRLASLQHFRWQNDWQLSIRLGGAELTLLRHRACHLGNASGIALQEDT
ncbi:uncharacterized protein LOC117580336 isoform X1 [Drosophila guanche]|uniref:uncharacterized protein LOC117580336 isoform X1 n=1 Tax=Drosophila guanche TaxID=7266 RepID=UPI00147133B0|nr:uncharacterized protein LOC117580336 isoform X1 [Drosophila guanche]